MCLITFQNAPGIAKRNITVYKILTKDNKSPFAVGNGYEYKEGINYPDRTGIYFNPIRSSTYDWKSMEAYQLGAGWLHSFRSYELASSIIARHGEVDTVKIVKMVIPKGASVYVSLDRDYLASDRLIYHKLK